MNRITLRPELLRWAFERSGRSSDKGLATKFPRLAAWARIEAQPTLRQLEQSATATFRPSRPPLSCASRRASGCRSRTRSTPCIRLLVVSGALV